MFTTMDECRDFCAEKRIRMIDFMMIDLEGRWRHLTIPAERFTDDIMTFGIGFDGSNYGFAPVEKSDMVFKPDLSTAFVNSFMRTPTLCMIGDVFVVDVPENRRFDQYPRNVAKSAEEYMRAEGIADEMRISPEFEFYVFDSVNFTVKPNEASFSIDSSETEWAAGGGAVNSGYRLAPMGGYHMASPHDTLGDFRSTVTMLMQECGIKVKYHHHEVGGPGQQEVEVEFGAMLDMADKTMLTKFIIKNVAIAEGKTATFMPKPVFGDGGNGMHVHMHLFKDGRPLFYDEAGYSGLSCTALNFIGGLLTHAPSLCAFTNPSTNSFKRLVPGYEAPVTVGYATANRSAVIRIPAYAKSPESKRFELRSPDGTCNPYYAYAAMLMAGIDGIKRGVDPVKEGFGPYDCNLYLLSDEEKSRIKHLPTTLDEALDALERDHDYLTAGGVFPQRLIDEWLKLKRGETARYNSMPQPVEYEMYFDM